MSSAQAVKDFPKDYSRAIEKIERQVARDVKATQEVASECDRRTACKRDRNSDAEAFKEGITNPAGAVLEPLTPWKRSRSDPF